MFYKPRLTNTSKNYVCRLKLNRRKTKRHSNFWVGLYGDLRVKTFNFCHQLVERLIIPTPNNLFLSREPQSSKAYSAQPLNLLSPREIKPYLKNIKIRC